MLDFLKQHRATIIALLHLAGILAIWLALAGPEPVEHSIQSGALEAIATALSEAG